MEYSTKCGKTQCHKPSQYHKRVSSYTFLHHTNIRVYGIPIIPNNIYKTFFLDELSFITHIPRLLGLGLQVQLRKKMRMPQVQAEGMQERVTANCSKWSL